MITRDPSKQYFRGFESSKKSKFTLVYYSTSPTMRLLGNVSVATVNYYANNA